eukprot:scaffold3061_cov106-Isochrysis_galbana.AAC.3
MVHGVMVSSSPLPPPNGHQCPPAVRVLVPTSTSREQSRWVWGGCGGATCSICICDAPPAATARLALPCTPTPKPDSRLPYFPVDVDIEKKCCYTWLSLGRSSSPRRPEMINSPP